MSPVSKSLTVLTSRDLTLKNHMSTVDDNQERQIRQMFSKGGSKPAHQGNNHSNAPHSTSQQNHKPASNGHSTNSNHSSNAAHAQSRPAAHSNNGSNAVSRNQQQTTHSDNRTNNRNNSTHSNTANDQEIILTITTRQQSLEQFAYCNIE